MLQNVVRKPLSAATSGSRYGFTLIELLVVIAIIAILAAILFPVFAKVREKARQSSCASNEKQIGLAVLQYVQDYDESYPVGWDGSGSWGAKLTWCGRVAPYINSVAVFSCPDDGLQGQSAIAGTGNYISYAGNSFHDPTLGWSSTFGYTNTGVFAVLGSPSTYQPTMTTLASVGKPSESIMISEKWASDVQKVNVAGGNTWDVMTSAFGPMCVTGTMWAFWPNYVNNIPDGGASGANVFPNGPNQGVSVHAGNVSNFVFCDGHVKAMQPSATDPNMWGQPQNDMWNVTRQ